MKLHLDVYLESFLDEVLNSGYKLKNLILDAPERASCRKQKQHGGYYSCDLCLANPENENFVGNRGMKKVKKCVGILYVNEI